MRPIENVKFFYMTLGEIISRVEYDIANRAHTPRVKKEERKELCYTNAIINRARYRVAKYGKEIFNKNEYHWALSVPLKVCIVNGKWIIIDGQGRLESFKEAEAKGKISMDVEIPVMVIEDCSNEMKNNEMRINNVSNVNWNADELLRHAAICKDENALKIMRELSDIQDELNLKSTSIPRMIMYGYDGFRKEYVLNVDEINPYKDIIRYSFKTLYESFGGFMSRIQSKIKTVQSAVALHQFFRNALKEMRETYVQAPCTPLTEAEKMEYSLMIEKLCTILSSMNGADLINTFSGGSTLISTNLCQLLLKSTLNDNRLLLATARRIANEA